MVRRMPSGRSTAGTNPSSVRARVVSKARLARQVWGPLDGDEHVVEVTVARLRKRLGPLGQGIETVMRRGYRLGV